MYHVKTMNKISKIGLAELDDRFEISDTMEHEDAILVRSAKLHDYDFPAELLCIARVMLCLPPMLILDEATSSIDTRTEIRIQKAFSRMMEGRTSFIVAHRLSTIREADRILVMKAGRIVEQGTHGDLLEKNGFVQCGIIHLSNGDERIAYEKVVKNS